MKPKIRSLLAFLLVFMIQVCDAEDSKSERNLVILATILVLLIVVMLLMIVGLSWKICKMKQHTEPQCSSVGGWGIVLDDSTLDPKFKINRNCLENLKIMKMEKLYKHFKGQLKMNNIRNERRKRKVLDVMVKCAYNLDQSKQRKLIELELKHLCECERHPNLLALVGFCQDRNEILIITEYPSKWTLLDFVRKFHDPRGVFQSFGQNTFKNQLTHYSSRYSDCQTLDSRLASLCTLDLLSFAWQIANGMKHMACNPYYHRQLTLSNIFVTSNKTIRIADFSLTRTHGNNEYYRKNTEWDMLKSHRAPETFTQERFSEKSDVWSYGVCLYELFSLGEEPYADFKQEEILKFVNDGGRLSKPEYCHADIYDIMEECWDSDVDRRPSFAAILTRLEKHFEQHKLRILQQIKDKLEEASDHQDTLENWLDEQVPSSS